MSCNILSLYVIYCYINGLIVFICSGHTIQSLRQKNKAEKLFPDKKTFNRQPFSLKY